MLKVDGPEPVLRRFAHPARRRLQAAVGEVTVVLGATAGAGDAAEEPDGRGAARSRRCRLDDAERKGGCRSSACARGVGYVPQGREIFGRLTVEENLRMGLADAAAGPRSAGELFELFPVLEQMMQRRGGDLSGGQQQQLAIAPCARRGRAC